MATCRRRCLIPQTDRAAVGFVFKAFPGAAVPGLATGRFSGFTPWP